MLQINLSHLIAELGWDAEFGEKKKKRILQDYKSDLENQL